MTRCAYPGCEHAAPSGHAVFCADHHLECEPKEARFLIRMKIEAARAPSEAQRLHAEEALAGYVQGAVKRMREKKERVNA